MKRGSNVDIGLEDIFDQVLINDNPVKDIMFSGLQEILMILLILLGLFIIPRMMSHRKAPPKIIFRRKPPRLSWAYRLAIVLSVLWPLVCAAYFWPWQANAIVFSVVGLVPVIVGWSIHWIIVGKEKK